ncbi:MAG: hypothetical protein IIY16_02960 [Oscillospiraceae bacterium]|nr:hypothetical protein [Oscillospiraceae bacterium]
MDHEITFGMELDGKQVTCTVLFTFSSEETNANYMLYTPDDPTGTNVRLMAARFDPEDIHCLYPLVDDRDRAIVQSFIEYVSAHAADEIAAEADDGIHTVEDLPS